MESYLLLVGPLSNTFMSTELSHESAAFIEVNLQMCKIQTWCFEVLEAEVVFRKITRAQACGWLHLGHAQGGGLAGIVG